MKPCAQWWRTDEAVHKDDWIIYEKFRVFLDLVWQAVGLPKPTKRQLQIADWLQDSPPFAMLLAFRGVAKSWITSAFVLWLLLRDPQLRILVVSATGDRADMFTNFCFRVLRTMPLLSRLVPRPDQRQSTSGFDVAPSAPDHTPSLSSRGIFGQITGLRADVIVLDDVEIPANSSTEAKREKLLRTVNELSAAVLKPGGEAKYLGTPQSFLSIYNNKPTFTKLIIPAQYPSLDKREDVEYWNSLLPALRDALTKGTARPGDPVDPERFPLDELLKRQAEFGRSEYQLQFQLDTTFSDLNKFPLKLSDLIVTEVDEDRAPAWATYASSPDLVHSIECAGHPGDRYFRPMRVAEETLQYEGRVMWIDPAGKGKDEVGVAVVYHLRSQLFAKRVAGLMGGYSDANLVQIAQWVKEHRVERIIIEQNFGQGMFAQLLKPFLVQYAGGVTIEERHSGTQKELRIIDTLEPVMSRHKLIVDPQVIKDDLKVLDSDRGVAARTYMLANQLAFVTRERGSLAHDDRLEALAGAVSYFVELMHQDEQVAKDEAHDRKIEEMIESIEQRYWDRNDPKREPNWMNPWD
jgi:hypothetical protein